MFLETREYRERRYLLLDIEPVRTYAANGSPSRQYNVTTVYLVRRGNEAQRLRRYDDEDGWWREFKRRKKGVTRKRRYYEGPIDLDGLPIRAIVHYSRLAFDQPQARITIDRAVKSNDRELTHYVVEVKGSHVPSDLVGILPDEDLQFSKIKWATNCYETPDLS